MNEPTADGRAHASGLRARVVGGSLAICLLAGCAASPANSPTPPPAATVSPVPSAAVQTTAPGTPTEEQPPLAELVANGSRVAGRLGSWCYGNACADIVPGPAELQPRVELAGPATELSFELPPPERFVYWRASYRATDDETSDMTILGEGGNRNPDPDVVRPESTPLPELSAATFTAPPPGEWLLEIRVQFPEGRGDAPYYWYAVVP
jgi:hypothetical protein